MKRKVEAPMLPGMEAVLSEVKELAQEAEESDQIGEKQFKMLRLLLEMDCHRDVIITLLEMFVKLPPALSRYLGGPIIVSGGAWAETTPKRALKAALLDRFDRVCEELQSGEVGTLATPAEVLAAMYGTTMVAPMHSNYADVYFWCGAQVAAKYGWAGCKTEADWWKFMGMEKYPVTYNRIRYDYQEIASDVRRKVVQMGQSHGYGKKPTKKQEQAESVIVLPPHLQKGKGKAVQKESLF